MFSDVLIEKDMLYPTDSSLELGCIHIQVFGPDQNARIPVVIEEKTNYSPLKYIDSITRIMQSDIFDRIFVDIRKNVDIYIKADSSLSAEFGDKSYIKVDLTGDKITGMGVNL